MGREQVGELGRGYEELMRKVENKKRIPHGECGLNFLSYSQI